MRSRAPVIGSLAFATALLLIGCGSKDQVRFDAGAVLGSRAWAAGLSGDFDGDGKLDLLTVEGGDSAQGGTVFLGHGDGTFEPGIDYVVDAHPFTPATGDFDGDGRLDLAFLPTRAYDLYGTMRVLRGNGDGSFQPVVRTVILPPTDGMPSSTVVDVDGDGKSDLVGVDEHVGVGAVATQQLAIFLSQGDGTFMSAGTLPAGTLPTEVISADFDGDGGPDVLVADATGNALEVFERATGSTTGLATPPKSSAIENPTLGTPSTIVAGDFNGDGKLDVAAPHDQAVSDCSSCVHNDVITAALGRGDGTFDVVDDRFSPSLGPFGWMSAADFSRDGHVDLAIDLAGYPATPMLLLGSGDGKFRTAYFGDDVNTSPVHCGPFLASGDFNSDGRIDLVCALSSGALVLVNRN